MYLIYLLIALSIKYLEGRFIYEDFIVRKCCSDEYKECCMESLINKKELNCNGISNVNRALIEDCLHRQLFSNEEESLKFMDSSCCNVFQENMFDPDDVCYYSCIDATQKYFLSNAEKWRSIKNCMKKNLPVRCFNKCVNWSGKNGYNKFIYEDHCKWSDKLKSGYVHLGRELESKK
uniref:DB domain-containing protein n=1 Tax=Parastrongyloides trichosuri TaxID=131310 RepID=A0A0N4ZZZ0_PARTI